MERINDYPGTISASEWLDELHEHQEVSGYGSLPTQREGRPLCQWVERMRRMAHAGLLPTHLALELARHGIRLVQNGDKGKSANAQAEAAFRKNMNLLSSWIEQDCRASQRKVAQITYVGTRNGSASRRAYTFLEHMRLKMRQGLLSNDHYWELLGLPITINGGSVSQWLNVTGSVRKESLGSEINTAQFALLRQSRISSELSVMEGERGEVYVAGSGTTSIVVNDGKIETHDGFTFEVTEWRRDATRGYGDPTLVFLDDMKCYGVLALYAQRPTKRAAPGIRMQYAQAAYKARNERELRRYERETNPFGWARGTNPNPVTVPPYHQAPGIQIRSDTK